MQYLKIFLKLDTIFAVVIGVLLGINLALHIFVEPNFYAAWNASLAIFFYGVLLMNEAFNKSFINMYERLLDSSRQQIKEIVRIAGNFQEKYRQEAEAHLETKNRLDGILQAQAEAEMAARKKKPVKRTVKKVTKKVTKKK